MIVVIRAIYSDFHIKLTFYVTIEEESERIMMLACKRMANSRATLVGHYSAENNNSCSVYESMHVSRVLLYLGGNVRGKYENAQWIQRVVRGSDIVEIKSKQK